MENAFRTQLPLPTYPFSIGHEDSTLAVGSCFAQHISERLRRLRFPVVLNPFGILYNPVSIANALRHILAGHPFTQNDLFQHQELWRSFDHHTSFAHTHPDQALQQMNAALSEAHTQLPKSRLLILTLGTAFAYRLKSNGQFVANCHQVPGHRFEKVRLGISDMQMNLERALEGFKTIAPDLQVLITVSPVRHQRDGLIQNQRSKAALLLTAEALVNQYAWVHYFPAYEWMMDELRDYRFYTEDLLHPNKQAIDFIWQKFDAAFFSQPTRSLNQRIEQILRAFAHHPRFPEREAHRQFLAQQKTRLRNLMEEYPCLDFSDIASK